jgi:uncharacterized protein (TIGR03083 family)
VDFARYLTAIRSDGERLAAAAELGLDAAVPSCPGWTVADLVWHTGQVHRHKEAIVRGGITDDEPEPEDAPAEGLIEWYRDGLEHLLNTLAANDPADPAWTWYSEDQTVGFWYRRMACETLVHRVDAELAHGVVTDVDSSLAVDGIDEIISVMMEGYPPWADLSFGNSSIRVETTDSATTWTLRYVTFSGTSPVTGKKYDAEPTFVFSDIANPSAVVRGESEDVLLYLWGRRPGDGLQVTGQADMLDALRTVAADVTQ